MRDVPGLNPGWAGGTANVARTLAIPRALRSILRSSHLYLGDSVTGEFRMLLSYLCFVTVRLLLCRSLPGATPNSPFLLECSRHFLMLSAAPLRRLRLSAEATPLPPPRFVNPNSLQHPSPCPSAESLRVSAASVATGPPRLQTHHKHRSRLCPLYFEHNHKSQDPGFHISTNHP